MKIVIQTNRVVNKTADKSRQKQTSLTAGPIKSRAHRQVKVLLTNRNKLLFSSWPFTQSLPTVEDDQQEVDSLL